MDATGLDPITAKTVVELFLSDIDALLNSLPLADTTSDDEVSERTALEMRRHEMQKQMTILEGRAIAFGVLVEEVQSRVKATQLLTEEKNAAEDRQLALTLAGKPENDPAVREARDYKQKLIEDIEPGDTEQWEGTQQLCIEGAVLSPEDMQVVLFNPNHQDAQGEEQTAESAPVLYHKMQQCCACMEDVPDERTLTLDCKPEPHTYCLDCLSGLFEAAIFDSTLFPPRCCKVPIPIEICHSLLPIELIKDFDVKVEEVATPNPTYCFACSKFLRARDIPKGTGVGKCPFCNNKTCTSCKGEEHGGLCPLDPNVKLLMAAAEERKWQQCKKCRNMVELAVGCFHMR
jgi:hypothetical protein